MSDLIDRDRLKQHYAWWGDTDEHKTFDTIVDLQPAVDVDRKRGEWIYEIDRKPCYASYEVHAKCSKCGWEWFSQDGVGNYSAVFGAFFTNYYDNPEQADAFLLENAKKNNKFICCPVCGADMRDGGEDG